MAQAVRGEAPMTPRTYRRTAYHEAGHALASFFYRLAGQTLKITMEHGELGEYNEGKHPVNKAGGLHWGKRTIWPSTGRSIDREQVHHKVVMLLAGPAAGWLYVDHAQGKRKLPKAQLKGLLENDEGSNDYSRALKLLYAASRFNTRDVIRRIPEAECKRLSKQELIERYTEPAVRAEEKRVLAELSRYYREAFDFIVEKWPHVQALADALFKKKTLEGDEIAAIIEGVEGRVKEGPPDPWADELQE